MNHNDTGVSDVAIVSGYFNPIHIGHLKLIHAAKRIAPFLVVVVNNDKQQLVKKGQIIMTEEDRVEIVSELRSVDQVVLAVDDGPTVIESLRLVRSMYPDAKMNFCNGGDRSSRTTMPTLESTVCAELGIQVHLGVGGFDKLDSSTRITSSLSS